VGLTSIVGEKKMQEEEVQEENAVGVARGS
jgi:hypothetical protein